MSNSVTDAFAKLNVGASSNATEFEHIFKVSYEYLSKVKNFNDVDSFRNCLVSLANLDKYYKAEQLIAKIPQDLVEHLILEISYIFYKIGKNEQVFKLYDSYKAKLDSSSSYLTSSTSSTSQTPLVFSSMVQAGLSNVLVQTYYKMGDYSKALELNEKLLQVTNDLEEKTDLIINQKAIVSQLIFQTGGTTTIQSGPSKFPGDETNYDLLFNEALIELAKGDVFKSLDLLEKAFKVCTENNIAEEDLNNEILPINLTMAYIHQSKGEDLKAKAILDTIDVEKIGDALLKMIVKSNLFAMDKLENPNLVERRLNLQEAIHQLKQKITTLQYGTALKNSMLLRFASGTLSSSQLNASLLQQQQNDGQLINQAYTVLTRNDISYKNLQDPALYKIIGKKLVRYIKQVEKEEDLKRAAVLLLVFVNSKLENFDQSLPFLEKLVEESMNKRALIKPGIVGTLINVYEKTQNINKLKNLLKLLVEKFLQSPQDSFENADYYNSAKIIAMSNYGFSSDNSRELFQFLHKVNPDDNLINSVLSNTSKDLLSVEELVSRKPVEELLSINLDKLIPNKKKPTKPIVKTRSKVIKKKQKPKFGKNRIIKPAGDFNLDDERWLPMKMRSYYKPSKRDRKKLTGHQGAMESTPPAAAAVAAVATPHAQNTSSNSSNSNTTKRKKKKGKK
ncbi:SRP72 [Candida oxycetoniae]|uniref:Signal recognition particle subunit SRP72 n=1 Tax=Candida oxycetoniae TaxID=497107 RepID=A0AAI9STR4_9ASCO|nr:SRP72 [Candida oxycetoniae]KAI3402492.2 SRP72 [Candida oxycetoniae]